MRASVPIDQPTSFVGRLVTAFVEITLATAVIIAAIVAGHNVREWRDWYATVYHPWVEQQRQTTEVTEP